MTRTLLILLLMAVNVLPWDARAADDAPPPDAERARAADHERLSGGFSVTRFVADGKVVPADDLRAMKVIRTKDRWSLFRGKNETTFADLINPEKTPHTIDITATSGAEKDRAYLGIYELGEDTVRICYAAPGKKRPAAFAAERGSGQTLIELRRFRAPALERVRTLPAWPVPGGQLTVLADVNDPDNGTCRIEYKLAGQTEWTAGTGAEVVLDDLKAGEVTFAVRAVSDRGGPSRPIEHKIKVTAPRAVAVPDKPEVLTNSVGMKFVRIPAGEFAMGARTDEAGAERVEQPYHGVRIASEFHIGQYEVTVANYEKVFGVRPKLENFIYAQPRAEDAWIEATPAKIDRLLKALNETPAEMAAGRTYRLPTEEEWEYSCRGGTTTRFWTGKVLDDKSEQFGGGPSGVGVYRWRTVGKGRPNPFGLYDMHGNTPELCLSRGGYWTADAESTAAGRKEFVIRGGSEASDAKECRSARRSLANPNRLGDYIGGVRLVCEIGKPRKAERKPLGDALDSWTGSTRLWTAKNGTILADPIPARTDAAMFTRDKVGDFTLTFDLKVTGAALFGLRFRGRLTNPDKDITDGPMFLFAGPDRKEDRGERYSWFTVMGRPRYIWASSPNKKKVIDQLVEPGKSNPVELTVRGRNVTAKLHDTVVWEGEIPDMAADGVLGLVLVSDAAGTVELRNFALKTDGAPKKGGAGAAPDLPRTTTWAGEGTQGGARFKATLNLTRDGDTISGTYLVESGGQRIALTVAGTVSGDTVSFKAYRGKEHWSDTTGELDLAAGTLRGSFTPRSPRSTATPGTIELKLKP